MKRFSEIIFVIFIIAISILVIFFVNKKNKENIKEENAEIENKKEDIRLAVLNLDTLNPILTKNRYVYDLTNILYDSIINLDENYMPSLELGESFEKLSDTKYIVKLKDVNWNNMEDKLTSDDVKFTVDKIKEHKGIYFENVKNIKEVNILDKNTLEFILFNKDKYFKYNLTFPIMKKVEDNVFIDSAGYGVPHGIGMYFLSKIDGDILHFKLNEKYYGFKEKNKMPDIKTVLVKRYKDANSMYTDFKEGSIDLLETGKSDVENFIGNFGYIKKPYKGRDFTFLGFNTQKVEDVSLRQSIFYVLDKNEVLNGIEGVSKSTFPLDFGSFVYKKDINTKENLDMAKSILEKAGYEIKNEVLKNGNKVELNIILNKAKAEELRLGENIKSNLEKNGIKVNLYPLEREDYTNRLNTKNYDVAIITIRNNFTPSLESFFGKDNYFNYINPNMDEILKEIDNKDEKDADILYEKLEEIYLKDMPFIPLYRNERYLFLSSALNGKIVPNSHNIFENFISWYRK